MVGKILLRGMLVGLVAGLLTFVFLKVFGEPQVDRAIAIEQQFDREKAEVVAKEAAAKGLQAPPEPADEEIISRPTQAGIGLFTGVMVYCTALGGLFALAFALCYGRMDAGTDGLAKADLARADLASGRDRLGPQATAALLAAMAFVAVHLVPSLKYPANPPSVGDPETIGRRTALYFALIALSLAAMVAAALLRKRLAPALGRWNASLCAGAAYLATMVLAAVLLPAVNEVPAQFPAVTLWSFRIASLGAQAITWTTLGVLFGALTHRVATREGVLRLDAAVV